MKNVVNVVMTFAIGPLAWSLYVTEEMNEGLIVFEMQEDKEF